MRLTPDQIAMIHAVVADLAGPEASVRLFGSRLDDAVRGGDVDLLVELPHPVEAPAPLAARIAGRISRAMEGRQLDQDIDLAERVEAFVCRTGGRAGARRPQGRRAGR